MEPFEYHVTGRDPLYIVVTPIGVALFCGALLMAAPWWVLLLWGLCAALLVWRYFLNPKAGMTLDENGLHVYQDDQAHFFTLDEIEHVRIRYESENPDFVRLYLRDGTGFTMPRDSTPASRTLRKQLTRFGISHDPA